MHTAILTFLLIPLSIYSSQAAPHASSIGSSALLESALHASASREASKSETKTTELTGASLLSTSSAGSEVSHQTTTAKSHSASNQFSTSVHYAASSTASVVSSTQSPSNTSLAPLHKAMVEANRIDGSYYVAMKENVTLDKHLIDLDDIFSSIKYNFTQHNAYHGNFSAEQIDRIRAAPGVDFVEEDESYDSISEGWANPSNHSDLQLANTTGPHKRASGYSYSPVDWSLGFISTSYYYPDHIQYNGPFSYQATYTAGEGVDIYILDSGVRTTHIDLEGRATFLASFVKGSEDVTGDDNGHGTSMASLAAGRTFGTAKSANIFSIKVADADGVPTRDAVAKGLDLALANHNKRKSRSGFAGSVINMSFTLGSSGGVAAENAMDAVVKAGIPAFAAAGNRIMNACGNWPALRGGSGNEGVITIGGMSQDYKPGVGNLRYLRGSAYGPCVNFWAPGYSTQADSSATPNLAAGNGSDAAVRSGIGTSNACALTAGVAAYMMSEHPYDSNRNLVNVGTIKEWLTANAQPLIDNSQKPYTRSTNLMINNGWNVAKADPFLPFTSDDKNEAIETEPGPFVDWIPTPKGYDRSIQFDTTPIMINTEKCQTQGISNSKTQFLVTIGVDYANGKGCDSIYERISSAFPNLSNIPGEYSCTRAPADYTQLEFQLNGLETDKSLMSTVNAILGQIYPTVKGGFGCGSEKPPKLVAQAVNTQKCVVSGPGVTSTPSKKPDAQFYISIGVDYADGKGCDSILQRLGDVLLPVSPANTLYVDEYACVATSNDMTVLSFISYKSGLDAINKELAAIYPTVKGGFNCSEG